MLNRISQLTKLYLKSSFSNTTDTGSKKKKITYILLYAFLFVYLACFTGFLSYEMINVLLPLRQEAVFIGLLLLVNIFLTFFETIISSMNVLYFAKDNEYILPMPIKAIEIVSAKINNLLIYAYATELLFGLIPFIIYGVLTAASWYFYLFSLLVLIILPIFPVLLASLIMMILMAFTKAIKNKSLIQILGIIVVFVFTFAISTFSSSSTNIETAEMLAMLFQANGLVNALRGYFPTLGFAIDALCKTNFLDALIALVILIAMSVALYFIFVIFCQKLYFRGVVGCLYSSSGTSKKKINVKTAYRRSGVAKSYILKEFKILFRKTTFLTQSALPSIIVPVMMCLVFYFSLGRSLDESGLGMAVISTFMQDQEYWTIILCVILAVSMFDSMYVYTGITSISRDGENAVFMKYIPVSFAWQCIYKSVPNFALLILSEVFVVILCLMLQVPVVLIVLACLIFIPYSIIHSLISIILDLRKPKLHWSNEYQVVKNNMRIFLIMVIALLSMIITLLPLFISTVSVYYVAGILFIFYLIIAIILIYYVFKKDFALSKNIY